MPPFLHSPNLLINITLLLAAAGLASLAAGHYFGIPGLIPVGWCLLAPLYLFILWSIAILIRLILKQRK